MLIQKNMRKYVKEKLALHFALKQYSFFPYRALWTAIIYIADTQSLRWFFTNSACTLVWRTRRFQFRRLFFNLILHFSYLL